LIFVWFYRLFPSLLEAAVVFKPETLVRWHRSGFRLYWRWKSRRRVGRPAVPADIRDLIRTITLPSYPVTLTKPPGAIRGARSAQPRLELARDASSASRLISRGL
jgi:hypothetical protein